MNPKISIVQTRFGAKSWRSCLQLLVALAILCCGSLARAQQNDTWTGVTGNGGWSTTNNWTVGGNPAVGMNPTNGDNLIFQNLGANTYYHSTNDFTGTVQIGSITFSTNSYVIGGNALIISNGIVDTYGSNSIQLNLTLGASQTFENTVNPLTATYGTNTQTSIGASGTTGTINLGTNTLTIAGGGLVFLNGLISAATNGGGMLVVNDGGGVARLGPSTGSAGNTFGTNLQSISATFTNTTEVSTQALYFTNEWTVSTNGGGSTNYFTCITNNIVTSNTVYTLFTNSTVVVQDVVTVIAGTLQSGSTAAATIPNGAGVGNVWLDGTLDLNGASPTINGLEDSGVGSGVVDNKSTALTGSYTLTVGNANSNGIFSGVIQNTSGTVGLTKIGFGTETLTGPNAYSGPTIVSQGTLALGPGGFLGEKSQNVTVASGAVLDVSALNPYNGYIPSGPLTVAAGTATKPYTNFFGSYYPYYPCTTNYVVTITTNNYVSSNTVVTFNGSVYTTNATYGTNLISYSYSTNSIASIVTADVVGNFMVNGGGAISPISTTAPGIATWTIQGNLDMDSSLLYPTVNPNRINMLLNNSTAVGGGTNDLIVVTGQLNIGDELDFVISTVTGSLATGTYTLIQCSNYVANANGAINNGDNDGATLKVIAPRGITNMITSDQHGIYMKAGGIVSPGFITWAGTPAANNWDVGLTKNWKNTGTNDYYYSQDNVTFDDTGVGTVVLPVVLTPSSMTFNNNLTNYVFTANSETAVTGGSGITLNGAGTVTLQNPNSFTGDVTVNGGTLALGFYGSGDFEHVLYHSVPAGNLILGGGVINLNEQTGTTPEADFNNLTINPGASAITQSPRTASSTPIYVISNNVTRAVGGTLNINADSSVNGDNGNHCGIFFVNTNAQGYYGVNGILGGYATMFYNDWVVANNTNTGSHAFAEYQTDVNPANWGGTSNVEANANPSASVNTETINSLKLNTTAPVTVTINNGSALTLASGGVLVPSGTANSVAINGGTLLGATNADLILLQNNAASTLTIGSVIADDTNNLAAQGSALTTSGQGKTILTGNNTYTGPTYISAGYSGFPAGTLQVGNGGTSGSIATSSAVIDNGTLAFNRSDNTSVSGAISGSGGLTQAGTGALTLTANSTLSGLVTVSSGTLQLGNGGAAGSVSNALGMVDNGTLVFDNNNTVSFPKPIGGSGGVIQFGSGSVIVATNETYSGNTVVSNGTMTLTASGSISNTAAIVVKSGGVFDASAAGGLTLRSSLPSEILAGNGVINGNVTTASGTTLTPGTNGVIGTLTFNNGLNLNGGSYMFDVGNAGSDSNHVAGALAENGGLLIVNVVGSPLANGVYPLMHAGSFSGSPASIAVAGFVQIGQLAVLTNEASGNLSLLVYSGSAPQLTWAGDGSLNYWDASALNWTNNPPGGAAVAFANPDFAIFDDTGSTNPAVDIRSGMLPSSVIFSNSVKNYVLGANSGSAGKISGGGSLIARGTGKVTLQTVNDYLGGTAISNNAVVQLGNNTAAAEDGMLGTGPVTDNGTLIANNFTNETIAGNISGSGLLVQQGNGSLILTGNNYPGFSGPISSANVLQVGNGISGTLGTGNVTNNGSLIFNSPGSITVPGNISGSGSVTNVGSGTVALNGTNTFAGTAAINAGKVILGSTNALPPNAAASLDVGAGVSGILDLNGSSPVVASLSGLNNSAGGGFTPSYIVNNANGTTSTLTINGGTSNAFYGVFADNNNGGSGKVALNVLNGSTLNLNPVTNTASHTVGTHVIGIANLNTFSGGILVSNSTLTLGVGSGGPFVCNNANLALNEASAAAGLGTITLAGTNWTGAPFGGNGIGGVLKGWGFATTTGLFVADAGHPDEIAGTINVPAGQFGSTFLPGEGDLRFTLVGGGTLYAYFGIYSRDTYAGDWSGFTGTVVFAQDAIHANGLCGIQDPAGFLGLPNANVVLQTNNAHSFTLFGTTAGQIFPMGSLSGGDATAALCGSASSGGDGGQPTIYVIGSLGTLASPVSTTFGGQVLDAGVGIRKVGYGTLTLTNNILSYSGQTVVSNGTLAFVPLGNNPDGFNALTNNYLVCSNFTIVDPGILDVTGMGGTLYVGQNNSQTLFGNGTLSGNLVVSNSVVAPGYRANDPSINPGSVLTITGTAKCLAGSTFRLSCGTGGVCDSVNVEGAGGLNLDPAALVVVTTNSVFPKSSTNVFQFFPGAVTVNLGGGTGITNIVVPTPAAGEFWVTNLDGNSTYPAISTPAGSMALVDTNSAISTNSFTVTNSFDGVNLTLSWPLDHIGYRLQSQTNTLAIGLYTNWVDIDAQFTPAANTTNKVIIPIVTTNGSVFYRLIYP